MLHISHALIVKRGSEPNRLGTTAVAATALKMAQSLKGSIHHYVFTFVFFAVGWYRYFKFLVGKSTRIVP